MSAISNATAKAISQNLNFIRTAIQPSNERSNEEIAQWLVQYIKSTEDHEYGIMRSEAITRRTQLNGGAYTKASH